MISDKINYIINNDKIIVSDYECNLSKFQMPFIYAIYAIVLNYQSNKYDDYNFQISPPQDKDFSAKDAADAAKAAAVNLAREATKDVLGTTINILCTKFVSAANDAASAAYGSLNTDGASSTALFAAFAALSAADAANILLNDIDKYTEDDIDKYTKDDIIAAILQAIDAANKAKYSYDNNENCACAAVNALCYGLSCIELILCYYESKGIYIIM
jgi:hypothetical protein